MRTKSYNQFYALWSLALLIILNGCTVNRVASNITTDARFRKLDKSTEVELNYEPLTVINLAENSEFFINVYADEAGKYQNDFRSSLKENNIWVGGDTARFVVEVSSIVFTEATHEQCVIDEKSQKEYCFWLNDIDISVNVTLFDRKSHKSNYFTSNVRESTSIKKRWLRKGYKESNFLVRNSDYVPTLISSCIKKSTGKTAKFIRKQYKRDARKLAKEARRAKRKKKKVATVEKTEPLPIEKQEEITIQREPLLEKITPTAYFDIYTGDSYVTKQIENNVVWMAENLRTSFFKNGDSIPQSTNAEEWKYATKAGKPTWMYFAEDGSNNATCGKMYNWFAVIDSRDIAPEGWHISTEDDWKDLVEYLGGKKEAGVKLKSKTGWYKKSFIVGNEGPDGNGNNESGLNCLPCGKMYDYEGKYFYYGNGAFFWVAAEPNEKPFGMRINTNGQANLKRLNLSIGYSVRCVKD